MKKVLVIEDNKDNIKLISFILEKHNYRVVKVETGENGVKKAKEEKFDLILMDIQLPGIDGLEATRKIREAGVKTPIVALTSYAMAGDKKKALDAGCTGYIEKPINPNVIISEIESFM